VYKLNAAIILLQKYDKIIIKYNNLTDEHHFYWKDNNGSLLVSLCSPGEMAQTFYDGL
jgi:hypothetical protein